MVHSEYFLRGIQGIPDCPNSFCQLGYLSNGARVVRAGARRMESTEDEGPESRVLVVDHDEGVRMCLSVILSKEGCRVLDAAGSSLVSV